MQSTYNGYDGSPGGSNLRRSRSIHSKLPAAGGPRRNPYDFLPDEPLPPGQTMVNESGQSRLLPSKTGASPRYPPVDGYEGDYGHHMRGKGHEDTYATRQQVGEMKDYIYAEGTKPKSSAMGTQR